MVNILIWISIGLIVIACILGFSESNKIDVNKLSRANLVEITNHVKKNLSVASALIFLGLLINILIIIDEKINFSCSIFHTTQMEEVSGTSNFFIWVCLIISFLLFFIFTFRLINASDSITGELVQKEEKEDERVAIQSKNREEADNVKQTFGSYDKCIPIDNDEESGYLGYKHAFYVSIERKQIFCNQRIINFEDIISVTLNDDSQVTYTQKGEASSVTTTNKGDMIGRAITGGVLLGEPGAIIGATTAQKDTKTNIDTTTTSHTKHNYTIILTIKDIMHPTCELSCADKDKIAKGILGTINAIIEHCER